jgi:hypothetical protein
MEKITLTRVNNFLRDGLQQMTDLGAAMPDMVTAVNKAQRYLKTKKDKKAKRILAFIQKIKVKHNIP